jgi:uncharacterized protein
MSKCQNEFVGSLEAGQFRKIDDAFKKGDLDALRAAVGDPGLVPNGRLPDGIGSCLVYAIYHSPLAFIRQLLEAGADANAPVDDAFPPLIAALTCGRAERGATKRNDVDDIIRLLLAFGANPNQRGINDYTALHMAVGERDALAVHRLLDAGADPDLRTRIDDYETPLEIARAAGLTTIVSMLERKGQPLRRRLRSGLVLLEDIPGAGDEVRRQHRYRMRVRIWLNREDLASETTSDVRVDRQSLVSGLFYGLEGMRVGGTRRLEIAPHLAYGDQGVPGVIPSGALLVAEITILEVAA